MKKYILTIVCLLLLSGCDNKISVEQGETPIINIISIEEIGIEVYSAIPYYGESDTFLQIWYNVYNMSDRDIDYMDYEVIATGFACDNRVLFQERSRILFLGSVRELPPESYTNGFIYAEYNDTEKLNKIDLKLSKR